MKSRLHHRSNLGKNLLAHRKTLGRVFAYWSVYHALFWHVLFLYQFIASQRTLEPGAASLPFTEVYCDFAVRNGWILLCAAGLLPLIAWDALRTAERLVGPLARFRYCLKLLAHGEQVTQVKVRRNDFLVELQDSFNEFLDSPYNTRRWSENRQAGETETHHGGKPARDEAELVLESLHEMQSSLWEARSQYDSPKPVAMRPRVQETQGGESNDVVTNVK